MLQRVDTAQKILGRGVYSAAECVGLVNFNRNRTSRNLSRQTVTRWLRGYRTLVGGELRQTTPLWRPDYPQIDRALDVSFRDLIELRLVKALRELGLRLPAIRDCHRHAVAEVQDERPFSTRRFQTDGKSIFLATTGAVSEGASIDLSRRQSVFHTWVAPSLRDLEFDADSVSRWYPLGSARRSIVIDPARAFGRPLATESGVPTEVLAKAVEIEGSVKKVALLYQVAPAAVRDAVAFEQKLAA